MTAVYDTNVIVSALLFGGRPRQALILAIEGVVRLFISRPMLFELEKTLARPKFRLAPEKAGLFLEEIQALCQPVFPREKIIKACRDQDDHIILECAMASRCEVLVTGDEDLLVLKSFRGIPILSVAAFLDRLSGKTTNASL